MARKTVSEQDRALAFIKAATREQLDSFIQTATLVRDVKWPAAPAVAKQRTAVVKPKAMASDAAQRAMDATVAAGGYGQQ